jgi:acetyl-CoA C-acetyltransferase
VRSVIVAGARTPFGRLGGSLAAVPAVRLGGVALAEAVRRAGVAPAEVDQVLLGMVVQAGAGQIPSRQATVEAGLPVEVPSETVNKVCASSLRAVVWADLLIRAGEARVVTAGGMESMSGAPYLVPGARFGYRMGDGALVDAMVHDGLWSSFDRMAMGGQGDRSAKELGISRPDQDAWALRSHVRAARAQDEGRLAVEIVPVEVPGRHGTTRVAQDEAIRRDTSAEALAALPPAFSPDGTITAGNAPGVNDGACVLTLMAESEAARRGLVPLGRIVAAGAASAMPHHLPQVPALAAQRALAKIGARPQDVALWEINEAFAAVTLHAIRMLDVDPEQVNVNGGAIALGHPIGASGARILYTLLVELGRRGGGLGVAAICSGGGQGEAVVVEVG